MLRKSIRNTRQLHLMLLPAIILIIIFAYIPMGGIIISFQKFIPVKGMFGDQKWVGLENFIYLFKMRGFFRSLYNTITISFFKIVLGIAVPIIFSILLNEVRANKIKRSIQTAVYLPHFLSWVVLASVFVDILSPKSGIINKLIRLIGFEPIFFLGNNSWFPTTMILGDTWKEFGFGTIIFMAAIVSIQPSLYEVAIIDGASWFKQVRYITIPGISHIIVLLGLLSLGNILNANFDQIFNLYSPQVYRSGDVIDTLVYRLAFEDGNFSLATAVGLFKSIVSFALISIGYYCSYKYADYEIF